MKKHSAVLWALVVVVVVAVVGTAVYLGKTETQKGTFRLPSIRHVPLESIRINFLETVPTWNRSGNAEIFTDQQRIVIRETGEEKIHAFKDVTFEEEISGNFALFISYTLAERLRPLLPNGNIDIAGLPYLHGYFINNNEDIITRLQGQNMRYDPVEKSNYAWRVSYGIFEIPSKMKKIRFFLNQASRQGVEQDGRAAEFRKPGLFIIGSAQEAKTIIKQYRDELSANIR